MDKKAIYLVLGIAVAVLFYVASTSIYEALFYSGDFSNAMYNSGAYGIVALVTLAMTWGGAAIYYYVINSVKFDRWWHWLATLAVVALLTPLVCYLVTDGMLSFSDNEGYSTAGAQLQLANVLISAVLFTVASFSLRWWSSNCRHTPIPQ